MSNSGANVDQIVKLSGQAAMGSGAHRDVYVHPSDSSLVLKIVRCSYFKMRKGVFRLRQSPLLDPNQLELDMWKILVASGHGQSGFFSKVLGWIDTDKGRALCVERIISDDATAPLILGDLIKFPEMVKDIDMDTRIIILSRIDEYYAYMSRHAIHSFATGLENIAFFKQNGRQKIRSFDAKLRPLREWIPITRHFQFARRLKVKRRTAILQNKLSAVLNVDSQ